MATVDIVIPVYNEEHVLAQSVATLRRFLSQGFHHHQWRILIADNASTDGTLALAQKLAEKHPDVASLHIPEKGRGRALKASWLGSAADIVSYMDVDLSTELEAFPPLIEAIASEGYHVATGSRLSPASPTPSAASRPSAARRSASWCRWSRTTSGSSTQSF